MQVKAHHVGLGTLAALVIHDLIVEEEKQLFFAGVRWAAQQVTQSAQQFQQFQQPQQPAPMTYFGWFYYHRQRRDPFYGYRGYIGQNDPNL
jgi:hypothetical protein